MKIYLSQLQGIFRSDLSNFVKIKSPYIKESEYGINNDIWVHGLLRLFIFLIY